MPGLGSKSRITAPQHFCPLHPNKQTRQHGFNAALCANCGHPVNNNVVRMSFVLLVSVFGVATPVG